MQNEMEKERSSDALVRELRGELNTHIIEVSGHMQAFKQHTDAEEEKWRKLIGLSEANSYAIKELGKEHAKHREQTTELIALNTRFKSVGWFASGIGKVTVALAAFIIAYTAVVNWFSQK